MTHASVFSGIGGPEVAATMLGWENLFHCEINPFGRAVLVSQGAMTQNPRIGELEEKMLGQEEWMQFSDNPLWPWTFGNCAIETGSSELRRIIKGGPQATHKIDPVHALLDALYCFDLAEGKVTE